MQAYFTVNVGRKFWDLSWCPLNRGCLLNMVSAQYTFHCRQMARVLNTKLPFVQVLKDFIKRHIFRSLGDV